MIIFIVFCFITWIILSKSRFGRKVYAIGGNISTARVSGINVEKNLVKVYAWTSFTVAVAGILLASRSGSAIATLATEYELDAIAAVTSMRIFT